MLEVDLPLCVKSFLVDEYTKTMIRLGTFKPKFIEPFIFKDVDANELCSTSSSNLAIDDKL